MEPAAILRLLVTAEGVRETQLQLARINAEAKRTADSTGRMEQQFNRLGQSAKSTAGLLGAAAVGAADVGSALGPLVGAGAGAVGLFAALGQGAVVTRLGLGQLAAALGGSKKAVDSLTPSQHALYASIIKLKDSWKGAATNEVPGFTKAVRVLQPLFTSLRPVIAATATELGSLAAAAGRMLASMSGSFQVIGRANVTILGNLGHAAIAFGQALIGLLAAAAPFTIWMSKIIRQGAQWVNSQVTAGQATGKLAAFLNKTKATMKLVGDVLKNLILAFLQIGKAMAPFGGGLLRIVNYMLRLVAHNPALARLVGILLNVAATAKVLSFLISPLFRIGEGARALAEGFKAVPKAVEIARVAITGLSTFLEANPLTLPLVALGAAIAIALTHWKQFKRGVEIAWSGIKHIFAEGVATVLGYVSTFLHGIGSLLSAISNVPGLGWVKGLADDVNHAGDSIDRLRNKLLGVGDQNKKTAHTVSTAWGSARDNLQRAITDMLHQYGDFHDKVGSDNVSLTKNFDRAYVLIEGYISTHTGKAKQQAEANLAELERVSGRDMKAMDQQTGKSMGSILSTIGSSTAKAAKQGNSNITNLQQTGSHQLGVLHSNTKDNLGAIFSIIAAQTMRSANTGGKNMQTFQQRTQHWESTAHNNTSSNLSAIANIVGSKTSQAAASAGSNMNKFAGNIKGGMTSGALATYRGVNYITGAVSKGLGALGSAIKVNVSLSIPKGFARGGMVNQPSYMVGEEAPRHPEVVIATNPAYRNANLKYWAQAGKMLGMPGFEQGGIPGFKTGGYTYPFPGGTHLGRTDQGVDTGIPAGGLFRAMGDAIIGATNIGGWPGGPLMNWTLQSGPARGRMVYLAEMIRPLVHSGQHVSGNTAVAVSTGPSQEMGWWTGGPYGTTLAKATGGYSEGQVTAAGRSFLSFIGGGKVGSALAAIAQILAPHVHGGGYLGKLVQVALDKTTTAANAFVQAHAPVFGGTGAIGAIPASSGNVERDIYKTLSARGWNKVAIAAAIGNAFQESGLNPGAVGSGGGGLFGFTSGAISLSALQSAAASRHVPWTDAAFQAAFMAAHYGDVRTLNAYRDPRQAALYFMNTFEKPLASAANIPNREAAAARAYSQGYAKGGWMPPFGGSFAGGGVVPGPVGAARTIIAHGGEPVGQTNTTAGPLVNIEHMEVTDKFDERMLAHKLAFLIET